MKIGVTIFLILYGAISIVFGLLNEKRDFWMNIPNIGFEKLFGKKHTPFYNILFGSTSLAVGILMLL